MMQPIALTLALAAGVVLPYSIDALKGGVPVICQELAIELIEAEKQGTITEETASEVFGNCLRTHEA